MPTGRTRKPTIWVFDARAPGKPLAGPLVFTGCNQRHVSLLAFNSSGELLASVGADDDHTCVLWRWEKGEALCHVPTQREPVYGCRFGPAAAADGAAAAAAGERLVLCGKGFARAYSFEGVAAGTADRPASTKLALPGRERSMAQLCIGFLGAHGACVQEVGALLAKGTPALRGTCCA